MKKGTKRGYSEMVNVDSKVHLQIESEKDKQ
jgi:hypothetical protein